MVKGMMKLMEGMQLSQILEVKKQKDVEVLKSSSGVEGRDRSVGPHGLALGHRPRYGKLVRQA